MGAAPPQIVTDAMIVATIYWLGASTGAWHPDIASLLAHHRQREYAIGDQTTTPAEETTP